jgi:6-phosphofructokinase 1
MPANKDFDIPDLGPREVDSPLLDLRYPDGRSFNFRRDEERIIVDHRVSSLRAEQQLENIPSLERAGAREKIYFSPEDTTVGIVNCGGLCPGLNNVIRDTVMTAKLRYGVRRILGFRYGFRGLAGTERHVELTPDGVANIHKMGGTILGTSRGPQNPAAMVDTLKELGVDILFAVGGDGTMKGALDICAEIKKRGLKISVVGVPKTIDNDFKYMDTSFGHLTAYSKALESIDAAHREAEAAPNGLGLVKLMGRQSGFIACAATLASNQVNFTLIPEVPFTLEGNNGLFEALKRRFESRKHAVVVVAEGAGQDLIEGARGEPDASGNPALADVGGFLAGRIRDHFKKTGIELTLKYIDPSYIIRSLRASPPDSVLCTNLAINAVHAAMCGKTEMVVGVWHRAFVHVPIRQAISEINKVDPAGPLWLSVLGTTGQPLAFS